MLFMTVFPQDHVRPAAARSLSLPWRSHWWGLPTCCSFRLCEDLPRDLCRCARRALRRLRSEADLEHRPDPPMPEL